MLRRKKDLWHLPAQASVSILHRVARLYQTPPSSKTCKTEASPLGSPLWKAGVLDTQTSAFPFLGEVGSYGVSSWLYGTMLGAGMMVRRCPESPYWLRWAWFCTQPGYKSLSFNFWISHKVNLFMNCCWIGVFVCRGRRVQGFLLRHLADVTPENF